MSVKLFVGSLSWNTDSDSLRAQFEQYGSLEDAVVIRDRETGRSRGFGFVTYLNGDDADRAVQEMDGQEFEGRAIKVERASERGSGRGGGGMGGRGGFGGGGGGGGDRFGGNRRENGGGYGGPRRGGW